MADNNTIARPYAQAIFEGLKAYRHEDGSVWVTHPTFEPIRIRRP